MTEVKKPILPKVIDYVLVKGDEDVYKREGIELVEVYPGRWDINIGDRPTNKKIRQSLFCFTGDDELVIGFGNMRNGFAIHKPSEVQKDQLSNEIRVLMRKYKFCNTYIDKTIEYVLKAIELNQQYIERKVSNGRIYRV